MNPKLGTLERHPDGVLSGVFRTPFARAQIELHPQPPENGVRLYEVIAAPDFQFGVGRQSEASPTGPIDLHLRAPELARDIWAQARHVDGDAWVILWLDADDRAGP